MRAGRFRHLVEIMRLVPAKDPSTGVVSESWVLFKRMWASIEPLTGRDFVSADQVQAKVSSKVVMRWTSGILPSMRVHHDGHVYRIHGVVPDKKSGREGLTLPVTEVQRG